MNEQSVASARASVLVYNPTFKKWVPSGSSSGISKVHIYHHIENNTFRVVGRKIQDHEVVINCSILKGLKYFQATTTFHQWRDNSEIHGLNFASRGDAETFALAMERVLDILGHSSNLKCDFQSQPLYQTIGHSGISLDDYAEYKGWMNSENGDESSEYGHYGSNHVDYSAQSPTSSSSSVSASTYSHHRTSSALSSSQQSSSVIPQQTSPQCSVPPPPPPPPPTISNISGIATLPRFNLRQSTSQETNEVSLAAALAGAKLKKTASKQLGETTSDENKHNPAMKGMACMLDEMTRTLARRRAQTGSSADDDYSANEENCKNWIKENSTNGFSPNKSCEGDASQSFHRSVMDNESRNQHLLITLSDMEKFKHEMMCEVRKEMYKMRQDIVEALKTELNRR